MDPRDVIRTKRDGDRLSKDQIQAFLRAYVAGEAEDYHAAALLAGIFIRGLDPAELLDWTQGMVESGSQLRWEKGSRPVLDKHSTGGVGDKASLVLAPALIALGARVPMISGRGLGHTGGTLDKLEAIPGLHTELPLEQIRAQVEEVGGVIAAQTPELVPADRKLYALRDAAGLVESVPLIASSILSKKLAEGLDALVLDLKYGAGSFLPTREQGAQLTQAMGAIAEGWGLSMTVVESSMEQPLGRMVGHAHEINESLDALGGAGPPDLIELTLHLGAELLVSSGMAADHAEARLDLAKVLKNGQALEAFHALIRAQGGVLREGDRLEFAQQQHTVRAPRSGTFRTLDCRAIGLALMALGGARRQIGGRLDHQVGIRCERRQGDVLQEGDALFTIWHRDGTGLAEAEAHLERSYGIQEAPCDPVQPPKTLAIFGG